MRINEKGKFDFIQPVLSVLLIASILVFIKVLPELPAIADTTEEFREDKEAIIDAPPLPETDTSKVGITNPDIFEPPPGTKGDNETAGDIEPSSRSKTLAGIVDALFYLLVAVLGGFGIYLMFKYRKKVSLKYMFGSLLSLVAVATCIFFGFMVYRMVNYRTGFYLSDDHIMLYLLAAAIPIGGLISYTLFSEKYHQDTRNFSLLLVGALMGSFLAALLPLYGVIPLVIIISLFDIYSVRRGPINKIMKIVDGEVEPVGKKTKNVKSKTSASPEKTRVKKQDARVDSKNVKSKTSDVSEAVTRSQKPVLSSGSSESSASSSTSKVEFDDSDLWMMYEAKDWSIGIGDFVIYSMFAAFVLTHTLQFLPYYGFYTPAVGFVLPWVIFLITVTGLLAGYTVTLKLLLKKPLLPGLPLAVFFGLLAFFISIATMEIINLLAYGKFAPVV